MSGTLYVGAAATLRREGAGLTLEGDALPPDTLDYVVLLDDARATSEALLALADRGVPVAWLGRDGSLRAQLIGPGVDPKKMCGVERLLALCRAHDVPSTRLAIARGFVAGRAEGMAAIVLRAARGGSTAVLRDEVDFFRSHAALALAAPSEPILRAVEGRATVRYWNLFGELAALADLKWHGRTRRPPGDPINAVLSFLSTLWTCRCEGALRTVGLDPQIGFLHVDRPGRMSLACDLVEEFRAPFVERFALSLFRQRILRPEAAEGHFEPSPCGRGVWLTKSGRRALLGAHEARLRRPVSLPERKSSIPLERLPLVQAERLASCLLSGATYTPYTFR